MLHFVQQYLALHHHISLKDWGSLYFLPVAAQVDFPNRQITAPSQKMVFTNDVQNEQSFINWLCAELNITSNEAAEKVKAFVLSFTHQLTAKQTVEWKGWGRFNKNEQGFPEFIPAPQNKFVPAAVTAERVIRSGAQHHIRVGKDERTNTEMEELLFSTEKKQKYSWWMGVLLFSITGIILAALFANNHNIQWHKLTSYQKLQPKEPPVLHRTP
ncbi:MAG: hypothetical protein K2X48_15020 [Chitinophagaceae bacterium]|nr:hypothetical protein [Chitinophagaceae bacterium]